MTLYSGLKDTLGPGVKIEFHSSDQFAIVVAMVWFRGFFFFFFFFLDILSQLREEVPHNNDY